jgi:hypothetical protein
MGVETAEYSGAARKDNVDKKAHVGKRECNEQIQYINDELVGLPHLHQVHSQDMKQSCCLYSCKFSSASLLAGHN